MNLRSQIRTVLAVTALSLVTLAPLSSAEASPVFTGSHPGGRRCRPSPLSRSGWRRRVLPRGGPADAPTVVLLHGFPSSSHMFRHLIPALATRYHVSRRTTRDLVTARRRTESVPLQLRDSLRSWTRCSQRLKVQRYALYVMDYGAPVGYRLAIKHPERVRALVVQNGNAYEEGLQEFWDPHQGLLGERLTEGPRGAARGATTLESTRSQYTTASRDVSRIDPSAWLTIRRCWIDPATWRFSSTCSTTTERT